MKPVLKAALIMGVFCFCFFSAVSLLAWRYLIAQTSKGHDSKQHEHKAQFGGKVASVGEHHVEIVNTKEGHIRAYIMGKEEGLRVPLNLSKIEGEVSGSEGEGVQTLLLQATPQEGEPTGSASLFEGKLPTDLKGAFHRIALDIPLQGRLYRAHFTSEESHSLEETHESEPTMPKKVGDGSAISPIERDLFLKPGGVYTLLDIAANGQTTSTQKFQGFQAKHNMNPKKGERICPITMTAANPQVAWVIGGKTYMFCCPPCVDEFLTRAKKSNKPLPKPETFLKK
jgi:YHS domain-containing protein